MVGQDIGEVPTWQLLAYVRSLTRTLQQGVSGEIVNGGPIVAFKPVTYEQLLRAGIDEPDDWLTYSGSYDGQRYSRLDQINRGNVKELKLQWVFQLPTVETVVETTPLVVNGIMYLTQPPNDVLALDARLGQLLWSYRRELPPKLAVCCGLVNRGVAILGDRVYLATLDAHLVALDARNGKVIWDVEVADHRLGYSSTAAPLAIKDKIVVGIAGGEFGIRGFLDAFGAETGARVWRFYTVPGPGEPGYETWEGDSWKTGGAPTWMTGSFDPKLNLIYWGVGNPGPVFRGDGRHGDNLYSNSVVALDADTGKLRWHFQFTPHDEHDWDSNHIPVLVDTDFHGLHSELLLLANKNAFYYVLDRRSGKFLLGRAFANQTWADGLTPEGRPVVKPDSAPAPRGNLVYPSAGGATNWWSPSYDPVTGLFYIPAAERGAIYFKKTAGELDEYERGEFFVGSASQGITGEPRQTFVSAVAATTGALKWQYKFPPRETYLNVGGVLSTAGGLIFVGDDTVFYALDAETGKELWQVQTGGRILAAPITYVSGGRQQVTIAAGRAIFSFAVGEP